MKQALDAAAAEKKAPSSPGDSTGESIGDAPDDGDDGLAGGSDAVRRMPRFGSLSPSAPNHGSSDSDEEDEAMLQAAANGKLSPPQPQASPVKPAANASVLETTPLDGGDACATTPDSGRRKSGKKEAVDAGKKMQQLHMSKLAAQKTTNDSTIDVPG